MNDLVLLRLTEVNRKRKLRKVREACQVDGRRFNDGVGLTKSLEKVLSDCGVRAGLILVANLGTRLVAFGGRDKGITKRHLGERKGMSVKEAAKPVMLMKL